MSGELVSLRALLVCGSERDVERLRQGAAQAVLPFEIEQTDTAGKAQALLERGGIDLVLIDSGIPAPERVGVVRAARASAKPPLAIMLGGSGTSAAEADAIAPMPGDQRDATGLFDRCARARLPSRVMVVDDSSTMRMIVRKILSASRFPLDISEADDGAACLYRVRRGGVDVVFLDYNMPGLDGIATLGEIKRADPTIDVVLMTSTHDQVLADRAIHAGARAFLKKPFYPAAVDALLFARCGLTPCKAAN